MKRLEELTKFYKGGGSPAAAIQSAPVPLPAPPVTENNQAVVQAEHDIAQANLLKKTVKKTIFAGDTGGWSPQNPMGNAQPQGGYKVKP